MPIDPVCGMEVDEDSAAATSEYRGKTYYFCAIACKKDFDEAPEIFLEDEIFEDDSEETADDE